MLIGIFQCFALIPGSSRSGTAITAGLLIGLNLKDASKFAFLLAIPTILAALTLLSFDLKTEVVEFNLLNLIVGFVTSMIFAFFTIKLFLDFVENHLEFVPLQRELRAERLCRIAAPAARRAWRAAAWRGVARRGEVRGPGREQAAPPPRAPPETPATPWRRPGRVPWCARR